MLSVSEIESKVREVRPVVEAIQLQVRKVIVGQQAMMDRLLIALLTNGHVLLEGVPGLAKTTAVHSLARSMALAFKRIQFTPDLLPADLVGTQIYNPRDGAFTTHKGPVFTHILLADEINRAPAKVQSALLEAMQERQVTISDTTHKLPEPFLVLATQNPIEQEGTYPLPEAQADRFMMKIRVGYPTRDDERQILARANEPTPTIERVCTHQHLAMARDVVSQIRMEQVVADYIVDVVQATRRPAEVGLGDLSRYVEFGASPRATISLAAASRAHAFLQGRGFVTPDDVKALGQDVLRHRVLLTYEAEAEGIGPEQVIDRVFQSVKTP